MRAVLHVRRGVHLLRVPLLQGRHVLHGIHLRLHRRLPDLPGRGCPPHVEQRSHRSLRRDVMFAPFFMFCSIFHGFLLWQNVYKVFHPLADLGWVDLDLDSSAVSPILLRQIGFWQKWLLNRAR